MRLKILFIHKNFPGQFKDIAPCLAENLSAEVRFLSLSSNPQNIAIPGVRLERFQCHREVNRAIHSYLHPVEQGVLNGQAVIRKLYELSEKGFTPNVVIAHSGFGFSSYIRCVYPSCKIIAYSEWYFSRENIIRLLPNSKLDTIMKVETRNLPILQESLNADLIITPTKWQASQFPKSLAKQIKIIFDGIDTTLFHDGFQPEELEITGSDLSESLILPAEVPILTYGTRGMEPMRGFPQFMRAAAHAQKTFSDLHVVVFGKDRVAYGMSEIECPHKSGSWKTALLEELSEILDLSRIHFTGLISYKDLSRLFRRTSLHCYFTEPYVVSWGVFQAAASGCPLLTNSFPGIDEVLTSSNTAERVNLHNQDEINRTVVSLLKEPKTLQRINQLTAGMTVQDAQSSWIKVIKQLTDNFQQAT